MSTAVQVFPQVSPKKFKYNFHPRYTASGAKLNLSIPKVREIKFSHFKDHTVVEVYLLGVPEDLSLEEAEKILPPKILKEIEEKAYWQRQAWFAEKIGDEELKSKASSRLMELECGISLNDFWQKEFMDGQESGDKKKMAQAEYFLENLPRD